MRFDQKIQVRDVIRMGRKFGLVMIVKQMIDNV